MKFRSADFPDSLGIYPVIPIIHLEQQEYP